MGNASSTEDYRHEVHNGPSNKHPPPGPPSQPRQNPRSAESHFHNAKPPNRYGQPTPVGGHFHRPDSYDYPPPVQGKRQHQSTDSYEHPPLVRGQHQHQSTDSYDYSPPVRRQHQHRHQSTDSYDYPPPIQRQNIGPCVQSTLKTINEILDQWREIIGNVGNEMYINEEQEAYLRFEIGETNEKWNKIAQPENKRSYPDTQTQESSSNRQSKLIGGEETIKELSRKLADKQQKIHEMIEENEMLRQRMSDLEDRISELTIRLSKQASDRLLRSNPNITDLSDANRPTKLGEFYSELYDNEYTEALVAVAEHGYTEREAIDTLRMTLLDTYNFCSDKANALLTSSEEAIKALFAAIDSSKKKANKGPRLLREQTDIEDLKFALRWKPKEKKTEGNGEIQSLRESKHEKIPTVADEVKTMRKSVASAIFPLVFKAYLRTRWDPDCIRELKPFIEKCVFLSWMMNVQSPAMAFLEWSDNPDEQLAKPDESLDYGRYRTYTKSGSYIDYVVWPTLMLTKDGPILAKGVAQGKD